MRNILENEKYIGDMLSHRTYTVHFSGGKRAPNDEILPQYYRIIISESSLMGIFIGQIKKSKDELN